MTPPWALLDLVVQERDPEAAFKELGRRVHAVTLLLPRVSSPSVTACGDCGKGTDDISILGCTKEECPLFGTEPVT